ncbi:MAG: hydroxysqualene dehydroxylase HpnE [Vicinamibacterales bacterium]
MTAADVVVVGAGCAGLSAGAALAEAGARVLIVEARPVPGGRTFSTRDAASGDRVDNGQHVLLGCYHASLAFARRIGSTGRLAVQAGLRVPMIDSDGRMTELRCPALPAPLHLAAGILGWPALSWREGLSLAGMARALSPGAVVPPDQTVRQWLVAHGQAPRLCQLLWEPLAVAALNQPVDTATATTFVEVLRRLLGPGPDDAALVLPATSLSGAFVDPAVAFIEGRGGAVWTSRTARVRFDGGRATGIESRGDRVAAAAVVSAVPWNGLAAVCGAAPPAALAATIERATAMRSAPIVTANLWFDRPVLDEPFVGLPGRTFQWVFDRRRVTPGEATHLSLVCSGAEAIVAMPNDAIVARAHAELGAAVPAAARATLRRGTAVRERQATFSLAAGEPSRPGTTTEVPGFFLAGDWIDTGLPATIESAVVSGHRAAAAVLEFLARPSPQPPVPSP